MRAHEFLTEQQLDELFGMDKKKSEPFQPQQIRQTYDDPNQPWAVGGDYFGNKKGLEWEKMPKAAERYMRGSWAMNRHLINQTSLTGNLKNIIERLLSFGNYANWVTKPIKELDKVLANSFIPNDMIVYHGTKSFNPGEVANRNNGLLRIPAYLSVSPNKNVAYEFAKRDHVGNSKPVDGSQILEIQIKKGQHGFVAPGGVQQEIILPRNTVFKIDPDPTKIPNGFIWHATIVQQGGIELDEMALPADWDAEALGHDKTFKSRLEYALERAPRLGGGSSRVAFVIPDQGRETVLKIAKNSKGLAQNDAEVDVLEDGYLSKLGILIPIIDYDKTNRVPVWLQTEKANKVSQAKLARMLHAGGRFPMSNFIYAVHNVIGDKKNYMPTLDQIKQEMWDTGSDSKDIEIFMEYVDKVAELVNGSGLMPGDLNRASNWGEYQGQPVIIDAGFTEDVFSNMYRRK